MSFRAARPFSRAIAQARKPLASRIAVTPVCRSFIIPQIRQGFASTSRRLGSGETDSNLATTIGAEKKYEAEAAAESPEVPEFIAQFNENGVWEVRDQPGNDDVELWRKFGNETIKLTFQVSDLDVPPEEPVPIEDTTTEVDPADSQPYITCSLLITKSGHPNAMSVDLEAGEEGFELTNVAMFDKALGEAVGSEGDWQRRTRYMGPQFEQLDPGVQDAFRDYLVERGVDDALAQFVISYCEYKEQKDYVNWLSQVKGFVEH